MKTSELTLDEAVAQCEGVQLQGDKGFQLVYRCYNHEDTLSYKHWEPSTNWAQAGPIIDREKISIVEECDGTWMGSIGGCTGFDMPLYQEHDETPLKAAMRTYVASKLGKEVNVID